MTYRLPDGTPMELAPNCVTRKVKGGVVTKALCSQCVQWHGVEEFELISGDLRHRADKCERRKYFRLYAVK